jgi:hypothetical protein
MSFTISTKFEVKAAGRVEPYKPPVVIGDPYWSNVVLLAKMEGANGGTTFTDSSTRGSTLNRYGDIRTSTTQKKFGSSSALCDDNKALYTNTSTDFAFGTGSFTCECWIYPTSYPNNSYFFYQEGGWALMIRNGGLNWWRQGQVGVDNSGINVVPANQWSHIAIARQSGALKVFMNGNVEINITDNNSVLATSTYLHFFQPNSGGESRYRGYMDEIRITKGVARYTASFTPTTTEFLTY